MTTPFTDIAEYESLRICNEIHKLRHSSYGKVVNSGPGQRIMLSERGAYVCFRIVESGLEIPIGNVASAVPKLASLASKLQKTTGSRLTPKVPAGRTAEGDDGDE